MPIVVMIGSLLAAIALWAGWRYRRRRRREALLRQPLAANLAAILARRVPLSRRLPRDLRRSLDGLVNVFLDEKRFVGCAGLEIDDEVRVTIAGHACLLLLGRSRRHFPGFQTILVYPDTFVAPQTTYDGFIEVRGHSPRSGESWHRGPVVLAWAEIEDDIRRPEDGRNVVLHEFAHKLDEENQTMDGLPVLRESSQYAEWAKVLRTEFDSLQRQAEQGVESVLDPYGAESPAEFFAVATEAFYQDSAAMRRELPELYHQLRRFYGLDPAEWRE